MRTYDFADDEELKMDEADYEKKFGGKMKYLRLFLIMTMQTMMHQNCQKKMMHQLQIVNLATSS